MTLYPKVGDTVFIRSGIWCEVTELLTNDRFKYKYKGREYEDWLANIAEIKKES